MSAILTRLSQQANPVTTALCRSSARELICRNQESQPLRTPHSTDRLMCCFPSNTQGTLLNIYSLVYIYILNHLQHCNPIRAWSICETQEDFQQALYPCVFQTQQDTETETDPPKRPHTQTQGEQSSVCSLMQQGMHRPISEELNSH